MKKPYEQKILDDLNSSDSGRNDRAFNKIYDLYHKKLERFIRNNGGVRQDSEDVFQEVLLVLFERVRKPGFVLDCSLSTFLIAIGKNMWLKKLKRARLHDQVIAQKLKQQAQVEEDGPEIYTSPETKERLMRLMSGLNEDCRKVLQLYYYERMNMSEIAKIMGYNSEQVAKNKKSRCIQALKQLIETNTDKKNIFPKDDYEE